MKKKLLVLLTLSFLVLSMALMAACGEPEKTGATEQEVVEAAMAAVTPPATATTASYTVTKPSGDAYKEVTLSLKSSNEDVIKITDNKGAVTCGVTGEKVTITVTLSLGDAEESKDFEVTVNRPHKLEVKTSETQHWQECTNPDCDYETEKADHVFGEPEIISAKGDWTDGVTATVCEECGYMHMEEEEYVEGFTFASTTAVVSSIGRPEELTLTPNATENPDTGSAAASMKLTLRLQLQQPAAAATTAELQFAAPRDSLLMQDVLGTVTIPAGVKTFSFEIELSQFFIPLAQDAYALYVNINNVGHEITRAQEGTFVSLNNVKNNAAYMYTAAATGAAGIRISRDADVTVDAWSPENIVLSSEEVEGVTRTYVTVSGRAYINDEFAEDTTVARVISIWFINEQKSAPVMLGEKLARTTENISTSSDTRDFTFKIDVTDLVSSGDWYKLTVGIGEDASLIEKTQTAGVAGEGGSISATATEINFSNGDSSGTPVSVGGARVVTAWGQVHLRK